MEKPNQTKNIIHSRAIFKCLERIFEAALKSNWCMCLQRSTTCCEEVCQYLAFFHHVMSGHNLTLCSKYIFYNCFKIKDTLCFPTWKLLMLRKCLVRNSRNLIYFSSDSAVGKCNSEPTHLYDSSGGEFHSGLSKLLLTVAAHRKLWL